MLKRKLSEFSLSGGNNPYSEDKESLDITTNPNNTKKKIQKEEMIKTYCRIRQIENDPGIFKIAPEDEKNLKVNIDELNTKILSSLNCTSFNFSKIFDCQTSQIDIFSSTCLPLLDDLIKNKKSGLIFAYGLTNAGKTHTIIGNPNNPGILPMALKTIYEKIEFEIKSKNLETNPELFCNYIEIYNEEIFDFLANEGKANKCKKKVHIKEKDKNIFYVHNVTNKPIKSIDDFNEALNLGVMKKTHAATQLNSYSSRSHTIFKLILRWPCNKSNTYSDSEEQNETEYEESTLSIVDLAGSERAYRAETSGKELQQACKINTSLYVLGKCMEVMKYNSLYVNKKIVPFRESKLTMLFQEYFQGDQNIIMITNINPSRDDFEETLRVLSYSCIAKEIRPIKSKIITSNNIRKKEKNSILESSSEDEDPKINNRFLNSYNKIEMSNQCVFNSNMNLQSYQNPSFMFQSEPFKNCAISENLSKNNLPSAFANHTPTLLNDIEMLKYQFVNMSKRYEEQLGKYEELERKNEFLLTKYKELQFQFKLRELDMRTNLIETISNQIFNNKLESFLTELEVSNNKYDNKSKVVIVNPFVYGKSSSIENTNIINTLPQKKDEINTQDAGHVIKSSLKQFENKNLENENVGLDRKLNVEMNKAASVKKDKSESKAKFFGKESTNTVDDFPNSQLNEREKEEEEEVKINNREESVKSVNPEKVEKSSDIQKIKKKKTQTETLNTKENLDMPERKNTKRIEEKTLKKNSEILEEKKEIPKAKEKIPSESVKENKKNSRNNNNKTKQSLKSKNKGKSYIEEEEDLVISDLDENRDHETQSIESIPSPVKATKNKKNNKKPTKQKKNTKKSNKTNSDTESDLDYSYESTYTNIRSKRNKNSTDYEEEIEEENSGNSFLEESKESSRDFKNVKKTKKKVAAAAAVKKTKKGKKTK